MGGQSCVATIAHLRLCFEGDCIKQGKGSRLQISQCSTSIQPASGGSVRVSGNVCQARAHFSGTTVDATRYTGYVGAQSNTNRLHSHVYHRQVAPAKPSKARNKYLNQTLERDLMPCVGGPSEDAHHRHILDAVGNNLALGGAQDKCTAVIECRVRLEPPARATWKCCLWRRLRRLQALARLVSVGSQWQHTMLATRAIVRYHQNTWHSGYNDHIQQCILFLFPALCKRQFLLSANTSGGGSCAASQQP